MLKWLLQPLYWLPLHWFIGGDSRVGLEPQKCFTVCMCSVWWLKPRSPVLPISLPAHSFWWAGMQNQWVNSRLWTLPIHSCAAVKRNLVVGSTPAVCQRCWDADCVWVMSHRFGCMSEKFICPKKVERVFLSCLIDLIWIPPFHSISRFSFFASYWLLSVLLGSGGLWCLSRALFRYKKQIMRVRQTLYRIPGSWLATLKQQLQPSREIWALQMCMHATLLAPTSTIIWSDECSLRDKTADKIIKMKPLITFMINV